jgi:hypothetical protein
VVTKGLAANDVVVITGQSRLAPGMRVSVTNADKVAGAQQGSGTAAGNADPG